MGGDVEFWDSEIAKYRREAVRSSTVDKQGSYKRPPIPTFSRPEDERGFAPTALLLGLEDDNPSNTVANAPVPEQRKEEDWVEYKSSEGRKLYFRKGTRAVRLDSPDAEQDLDPTQLAAAYHRAHRASGAKQDSWGRDSAPKPETGFDDALMQSLEEDSGELTMEAVVDIITRVSNNMQRVVEDGQDVPPEALVDLRILSEELSSISVRLEGGKQYVDERNDVDALVDYKHLAWNFNNSTVDYYRAAAVKRPHKKWAYSNWHIPEYLSSFPLPTGQDSASCVVSLPPPANKDDPVAMAHTTTRIQLDKNALCSVGIQQAFKSIKGGNAGSVSEYVLKAQGLAEYMMPKVKFFNYGYVRHCLRDNLELKLSLVKRPQPKTSPMEDLAALYRSMVKPDTPLMTEDVHKGIRLGEDTPWYTIKCVPMFDMALPLRVRLCGLDNVNELTIPRLVDYEIQSIHLQAFIFHGAETLENYIFETSGSDLCSSPRWYQWLSFSFLNTLPRAARLGIVMVGKLGEADSKASKSINLGYVVHQLVDTMGVCAHGSKKLAIWGLPGKDKGKHGKKREDPNFIHRATNRPNLATREPCTIQIDFDEFVVPVVAPLEETLRAPNPSALGPDDSTALNKKMKAQLNQLKAADPLTSLSKEDKGLIWISRNGLVDLPHMLPKFLQCVDWGNREHKFEALRLLKVWAPPKQLVYVMELLDYKYADYTVRKYAVDLLRQLKDEDLQMYLLQFTQCLKFEAYHDSPLSRFLIERAIRSPYIVGHHFFWHLKAELHDAPFSERFGLILEEYLSLCGRYAAELRKQNNAVLKLQRVAEMIVRLKREEGYGDEVAKKEYVTELRKLNRTFFGPMGRFHIPLDPKWEATTLILDKCRYMSSKMVPLWLVFNNADETAAPIYIMFKSGDDLRQDILTLQMLRIMDSLWLQQDLDMRLRPYRCVATGINDHGEGVGMLEIVLNSDTTSGIQLEYGGGAMGALKMNPIDLFLKAHNKARSYDDAVVNFVYSCAGYCVATYVMGIGDRHNGNIMVTKDGHLFHIDFGHFLGNFKSKFGVKRERAAFVFTPEMAFVMGGKRYKRSEKFQTFMDSCTKAYAILRENAGLLETMFSLMVSAGMPELMMESDIYYLKEMLHLDCDSRKAEKKLVAEVHKSLNTMYRRVDNMIHNFKHGG